MCQTAREIRVGQSKCRTSFSKLSSKLSLFLRWLRMNSAMGLLLLPSWLRLKVPSLFSFLYRGSPDQSLTLS